MLIINNINPITIILTIFHNNDKNRGLGLSCVKSIGLILVLRRVHLFPYSDCTQYLRISSTKSLSNVCVCPSPLEIR